VRATPSKARGVSKKRQKARSASALDATYLRKGGTAAPSLAHRAGAASFQSASERVAPVSQPPEATAAIEEICTTRAPVKAERSSVTPCTAGPMTRDGSPGLVVSRGEAAWITPATPAAAEAYAPGWGQWR
jgi:hypothetical protein